MPVKLEDIRKGRIAVIEAEILEDGLDGDGDVLIRNNLIGSSFVSLQHVVAVKDAPYKPEVGHVVTWGNGTQIYSVIAIVGGDAWLRCQDTGSNIVRAIGGCERPRRVA